MTNPGPRRGIISLVRPEDLRSREEERELSASCEDNVVIHDQSHVQDTNEDDADMGEDREQNDDGDDFPVIPMK